MIKALIIGVSDYTSIRQHDLPFCKNDIYAIRDALILGLKKCNEKIHLIFYFNLIYILYKN